MRNYFYFHWQKTPYMPLHQKLHFYNLNKGKNMVLSEVPRLAPYIGKHSVYFSQFQLYDFIPWIKIQCRSIWNLQYQLHHYEDKNKWRAQGQNTSKPHPTTETSVHLIRTQHLSVGFIVPRTPQNWNKTMLLSHIHALKEVEIAVKQQVQN